MKVSKEVKTAKTEVCYNLCSQCKATTHTAFVPTVCVTAFNLYSPLVSCLVTSLSFIFVLLPLFFTHLSSPFSLSLSLHCLTNLRKKGPCQRLRFCCNSTGGFAEGHFNESSGNCGNREVAVTIFLCLLPLQERDKKV